jgi:hypothetical protein
MALAALVALAGCAKTPLVVVDSTWSDKELRLLVAERGNDDQPARVVRCERGPDGALTKCVAMPIVFEGEK